jgi:hypothetical protein
MLSESCVRSLYTANHSINSELVLEGITPVPTLSAYITAYPTASTFSNVNAGVECTTIPDRAVRELMGVAIIVPAA